MRLHLLSPGDPTQRTGGYLYNARLAEALVAEGVDVRVHALPGPWPEGPDDPVDLELPEHEPVFADGLLWTGLRRPDLAARTVVCVHSPLSAEGGPSWRAREAAALAGVASVVATGGPTARDLKAMGVPSQRLVPGTRPAHRTRAPERPGPLHVVMLCTLTPRKALHRALDALRAVPDARLTVAGSTERDPTEAERLRARVHELGLGERVRWAGELDDRGVDALLAEAHLLLHTARYEAWGMALTEAMARGVPVLTTPAGAAEEGGAWVLPAEALPDALATLDTDRDRLRALADDAWRRGRSLPTWPDQARRLLPLLPETR